MRYNYVIGQMVGKCELISFASVDGKPKGVFKCPECGKEFTARMDHVRTEATKSCGCLGKHGQTRADGYRSPEYKTWTAMMKRCYGGEARYKKSYADKGVIVCDRWHNVNNFIEDMGKRPAGHTLDRFPNQSGNYEPGNCRWATPKMQANNLSWNLLVTYKGDTKTLPEWCDELGLEYNRMRNRIFLDKIPVAIAFREKKRSRLICMMMKAKRNPIIRHAFAA